MLAGIAVIVAFAAAFLLAGLYFLLPGDDELARRAEIGLGKSLGVPVTIGLLRWQLLPSPRLIVEDAATVQPQPIRIRRILLRPDIPALLVRRVLFKRIELSGATVPQLSLNGLAGSEKEESEGGVWRLDPAPPARVFFRDLTWVSRRGLALVYDGEIEFDPDWRPRTAELRRPDVKPITDLRLERLPAQEEQQQQAQQEKLEGQAGLDRWSVRLNLGGGTSEGELRLKESADGRLRLDGTLQSRGVDVASTMAAFDRPQVLAGTASGPTALWAEGDSAGALARSLHTRSRLQITDARLLKFDVDKAVKSAGTDHSGQTQLDSLALQLDTQNTASGMVLDYTGVKASSGAFTASGRARLSSSRQINAEFEVDLVEGIVGVPLLLSGPIESMAVSVPKSAIAGAAIGTAVLPGVGTAIGARLGAGVGKLFGGQPAAARPAAARPAPGKPAASRRESASRSVRPLEMPTQGGPGR